MHHLKTGQKGETEGPFYTQLPHSKAQTTIWSCHYKKGTKKATTWPKNNKKTKLRHTLAAIEQ
jgi:hypothetical protein